MTTEAEAAPKATWRHDGPNGSMEPRSAIDVLVDLNDKVTTGKVGEYQPVPLGFTPLDKTIGEFVGNRPTNSPIVPPTSANAPGAAPRPGHR